MARPDPPGADPRRWRKIRRSPGRHARAWPDPGGFLPGWRSAGPSLMRTRACRGAAASRVNPPSRGRKPNKSTAGAASSTPLRSTGSPDACGRCARSADARRAYPVKPPRYRLAPGTSRCPREGLHARTPSRETGPAGPREESSVAWTGRADWAAVLSTVPPALESGQGRTPPGNRRAKDLGSRDRRRMHRSGVPGNTGDVGGGGRRLKGGP